MLGKQIKLPDWQQVYGHPIVLAESFVDPQLFRGTAYTVSGWQAVGQSAGFKRVAEDFSPSTAAR